MNDDGAEGRVEGGLPPRPDREVPDPPAGSLWAAEPEQGSLWEPSGGPAWTPPSSPGWPFPLAPAPIPMAPPRRKRAVLAAVVAAIVLISGGIGVGIGWDLTKNGGTPATSTAKQPSIKVADPATPSAGPLDPEAIAAKVDPAVVDINTVIQTDAFGGTGRAAGTGMVVTSNGEILTNNHVIAGATTIRVTFPSTSKTYTATVVGADPTDDVALLQIEGVSGLSTVTFSDSSSLRIGQDIVAIGNALGRGGEPAVTTGIVAALRQTITVSDDRGGSERLSGLIQTNAPIQPGDSGGPLVNAAGQVVGMITAAGRTSRFQGTSTEGYAISSNSALTIVNQIRSGQATSTIILGQPGYLGVGVRNLDAAAGARLGLKAGSGVLVLGVTPGRPAERAGITQGSVITAIDGTKVTSADALGSAIRRHKPGEQIKVTWIDQSGTHTATVRLVSGPAV